MEVVTVLDLNKTIETVVGKLLNLKRTDEAVKEVIEAAKKELKNELESSNNKGENNLKIVNWIKENYKEQESEENLNVDEEKQEAQKPTQKKYVQQEIEGMKKRGGWRGGGRPKSTGQTTIAIRIDKRLEETVNELKEQLKNGTINEKKDVIKIEDLKKLLEKTKKEHEERYFKSSGEEKIKNYAMATAITHFDIFLDIFIKENC